VEAAGRTGPWRGEDRTRNVRGVSGGYILEGVGRRETGGKGEEKGQEGSGYRNERGKVARACLGPAGGKGGHRGERDDGGELVTRGKEGRAGMLNRRRGES